MISVDSVPGRCLHYFEFETLFWHSRSSSIKNALLMLSYVVFVIFNVNGRIGRVAITA